MSDRDPLLDRFARETEARRTETARLNAFVREQVDQPRRRPWWIPTVAVSGLALAAATTLLLVLPPSDRPVEADFSSPDEWVQHEVTDGVSVRFVGSGKLAGTEREPVVAWEAGTVLVDVEPGAGHSFTVRTPEAEVRVKGTIFEVVRDALGTRVSVRRGAVEATCMDGSVQLVTAGDEHTCLPRTAGALLGRARALQDAGAPPEVLLATADQGLSIASEGSPIGGELLVLRIDALMALGRNDEALVAAEAYVVSHSGRRAAVVALALELVLSSGDCAAMDPFLPYLTENNADLRERVAECGRSER